RERDRVSAMSTPAGVSADRKTVVVLGTATPGGGFPVYGAAVVDTVNETEPTLAIEQRNTKGSTENVPLLEAGRLDIALVQGEVAHEAFNGIGRSPANLTIVAAMYSTPGMFVVRADSPYRRLHDLRATPVVFGARGSGLVILAKYVLDGLGLDQERDFQAVYLDRAGDGPAMVLDGRAAALWGGGQGWPGFGAVAGTGPARISPIRSPAGFGLIDEDQKVQIARRMTLLGQRRGDLAPMLGRVVHLVDHLLPQRIRPPLAARVAVLDDAGQIGVRQVRHEPPRVELDLVPSRADRSEVREQSSVQRRGGRRAVPPRQ